MFMQTEIDCASNRFWEASGYLTLKRIHVHQTIHNLPSAFKRSNLFRELHKKGLVIRHVPSYDRQ